MLDRKLCTNICRASALVLPRKPILSFTTTVSFLASRRKVLVLIFIFFLAGNNFSDEVSRFLTGAPIPSFITGLPEEALNTPMGQMFKPMIESMEMKMREQGGGMSSMGVPWQVFALSHSIWNVGERHSLWHYPRSKAERDLCCPNSTLSKSRTH